MPECCGPLWPCALTGAAACLAGVRGIGVIIHGSSGCYFYPATVLHAPLHCTFLTEEDLIHGSHKALLRTVESIRGRYSLLAVLCSCTPSITGEDIRSFLEGDGVLVIDSPGFMGEFEEGYHSAAAALTLEEEPGSRGVNIDGISLMDPFSRGNIHEVRRILHMGGMNPGATLFGEDLSCGSRIAPWTVSTNPDLPSGRGTPLGSFIGLEQSKKTVRELERVAGMEGECIWQEIADAEERIGDACDKFLRRFDPPSVALFGQFTRMNEIAVMLERCLDARILAIGARNTPGSSRYAVRPAREYAAVEEILRNEAPDLILGSSFEQGICPDSAFVGLTHPVRGEIRLHARPIAGIEGALYLMDSVLNACIDRQKRNRKESRPDS